jgi:hypothetical protein
MLVSAQFILLSEVSRYISEGRFDVDAEAAIKKCPFFKWLELKTQPNFLRRKK